MTSLVALIFGCVAAHVPILVWIAKAIWQDDNYHFVPIALGLTIWLGIQRFSKAQGIGLYPRRHFAWFFLPSLMALASAIVLDSSFLGGLSIQLSIMAAVLAISGRQGARLFFPFWLMLWTMIPLPGSVKAAVLEPARKLSIDLASTILSLLQMSSINVSNILFVNGAPLENSEFLCQPHFIFAAIFAVTAWSCVKDRSLLQCLLLLAAAWIWSVIGNALRLVTTAVLVNKLGLNLTSGIFEKFLSFLFFACVFMMVLSLDRLLEFTFLISLIGKYLQGRLVRATPQNSGLTGPSTPDKAGYKQSNLSWPLAIAFSLGFLFLLITQLATFFSTGVSEDFSRIVDSKGPQLLPKEFGNWKLDSYSFESSDPKFHRMPSRIWEYESTVDKRKMQVRLVPLRTFPPSLVAPLASDGWEVLENKEIEGSNIREFQLVKLAGGQRGVVLSQVRDFEGKPLYFRLLTSAEELQRRVARKFPFVPVMNSETFIGNAMLVTVFFQLPSSSSVKDQSEVANDFAEVLKILPRSK